MQTGPSSTPDEASAVHTQPAVATPASQVNASSWLRDLLFSIVVSFLIITFLYQPVEWSGEMLCNAQKIVETAGRFF